MSDRLADQLAALGRMTVAQLRVEYERLFTEPTRTHNRVWLLRRIAWRLQALAEGDLSERARQRAAELANDADLRLGPPRVPVLHLNRMALASAPTVTRRDDNRHPLPGTIITRVYKGAVLEVKVLSHGFEYHGVTYRTLSAVAKAITGSHCSGYGFFQLRRKEAS